MSAAMDAAEGCNLFWCSATTPGQPFGPWPLWLFDGARAVVFLAGGGGIVLTYAALAHAAHGAPWAQQTRWLAALLFTVAVIGTEIERFGDYASWRLIINLAAVLLNLSGLWHYLRHETGER